jgi:hypothetical protein
MWVDQGAEVATRMADRVHDAEARRLAARAAAGRPQARRRLAGYGWRLREAAGFGLVRTGLRLLDARRAWS